MVAGSGSSGAGSSGAGSSGAGSFWSAPDPLPAVQLLSPTGQRLDDDELSARVAHVGPEQLRARYREMTLMRRFDTEATALQRQGELALWASSRGQEAAQVGAAHALRAHDHIFPTYREHGLGWMRGLDPVTLLSMYRGTSHGGWDPASFGFHLYTLVIGAQTLHATGYAMGVQRDGAVGTGDPDRDTAVIACLGDGATAQGEVSESMVWAGVFNAPVVFFCQNNQWAISEPNERQSRAPLYQRAAGFGFPGVRVDGNDVLAVEAVVGLAAERARSGEGPTLVEAFTYRMSAHTTSDDTTRYRSSAQEEHWRTLDPIARVQAHLSATDEADEAFFAGVEAEAAALGEHVRHGLRATPEPAPTAMFDHVYAEPHPLVDEERAWLEQWLATEPQEVA